ncbi:MAG: 50S ribosomal protein L21 [Holosporales bacterium]|jgi:large subunit ribosomal protein L21|nr:50S ribosomal protein L21 [Holosporales bacterium]
MAVITTGGKQYKVIEGEPISVEKLPQAVGKDIIFSEVLVLQENEKITVGVPYVPGAVVKAKVLAQKRTRKILVFKKRRRKNYRRANGHRQPFTVVKISQIKSA